MYDHPPPMAPFLDSTELAAYNAKMKVIVRVQGDSNAKQVVMV